MLRVTSVLLKSIDRTIHSTGGSAARHSGIIRRGEFGVRSVSIGQRGKELLRKETA
jgi:hypothetical protein